jgi:hypothetical protein
MGQHGADAPQGAGHIVTTASLKFRFICEEVIIFRPQTTRLWRVESVKVPQASMRQERNNPE